MRMNSVITSLLVIGLVGLPTTIDARDRAPSVFASSRATTAAIQPQPGSELENQLWLDSQDGQLQDFSLMQASLVASGVSSRDELGRYERLFETRYKTMSQVLATKSPTKLPAESYAAFRSLYCFGDYDLSCSSTARMLKTGDYNCVSATVLYLELTRRLKLHSVACAVPSHVKARLLHPQPIDVETTSTKWLGEGREPTSKASEREITDVSLLGKIYYNRASAAIDRRDFAAAARYLQLACQWDPADTAARDNRSAAMNNWAIELSRQGHNSQAKQVLSQGLELDPSYRLFKVNLQRLQSVR